MKRKITLLASGLCAAVLLFGGTYASAAENKVAIDHKTFTDTSFMEYIKANYDKDKDNYLSEAECDAVTEIILNRGNFEVLDGFKYFTKLTKVSINENAKLDEVDFGGNTSIKAITVKNNPLLVDVDASKMTGLETVDVTGNAKLEGLALEGTENLVTLDATANNLKAVDVRNSAKLKEAAFDSNTYADLSSCNQLSSLKGNFFTLFANGSVRSDELKTIVNNSGKFTLTVKEGKVFLGRLTSIIDDAKLTVADSNDYSYDNKTGELSVTEGVKYPFTLNAEYEVNGTKIPLVFEITDDTKAMTETTKLSLYYPNVKELPLIVDPAFGETEFNSDHADVVSVDKTSGKVTIHKPGRAVITATGKNATKTFEFTVVGELHRADIALTAGTVGYNGVAHTGMIAVAMNNEMLRENIDYTVSYENNTQVGTARIKISGIGNYTGTVVREFAIIAQNIAAETVAYSKVNNIVYQASAQLPEVAVTWNNAALVKDRDYTVRYENNIHAGKASIIFTGKGNFTGEKTVNFTITRKPLSDADLVFGAVGNKEYNKDGVRPDLSISYHGETLVAGKDYTLTFAGHTWFGTATVTAHGIGNYTNNKAISFNIVVGATKNLHVTKTTSDSVSLNWNDVEGAYAYRVYRYNPKTTNYTHIATVKKSEYVNKSLTFSTTYKYKVRAYKTINGKASFGAYTPIVTATTKKLTVAKPKTPTLSSVKAGKKQATVKWKKVTGVTGYKVYMKVGAKGKYKLVSTRAKASYTSYVKKSLKKGQTCYFKVRAYKKVSGVYFYSNYSKVKSVKIK